MCEVIYMLAFSVCDISHFKASTAKLAFLPASSHTPPQVFTCRCKKMRAFITCNSLDEVNWLIKKLPQMTGQTHKWESPSKISQWHPLSGDQGGEGDFDGLTWQAWGISGFASHLRARHPLLSLSHHLFLCQLLDQPANFVEWAATW